jgi:amphi-Trp domain-containing protein
MRCQATGDHPGRVMAAQVLTGTVEPGCTLSGPYEHLRGIAGPRPAQRREVGSVADVEIKRKIRLSRKQAGDRLIALGKALAGASTSELDFDGDSIRFTVADELEWEFELEVDGDEMELEIELKWSHAAAAPAAPVGPKRVRNSRRGGNGG